MRHRNFQGMIRLGFSASSSWLSKIICWLTGASVSHCFFLVDDPVLGDIIVDADWCGLSVRSRCQFEAAGNQVLHLVDPKVALEQALKGLAGQDLGEGYDYWGLLGMVWVLLGRKWLQRKWRNPLVSAKSMICSRFLTLVLQEAGWPGAATLDASAIDPGELEKFVTN